MSYVFVLPKKNPVIMAQKIERHGFSGGYYANQNECLTLKFNKQYEPDAL